LFAGAVDEPGDEGLKKMAVKYRAELSTPISALEKPRLCSMGTTYATEQAMIIQNSPWIRK
jgi:hypothetical protein